jgi:protease-4
MRRTLVSIVIVLIVLLGISLFTAFLITQDSKDFDLGDKVAIINIHGAISQASTTGVFAEEGAVPASIVHYIDQAESDGSVKAIVFDINSPGGSVVASEEIALAIRDAEKPTVCWFNEIAASGGYYAASQCDHIMADRGTITGSIGVISVFPEYTGLLEKLGLNVTIIKAGENKDFSSGMRPMTDEEIEMMDDVIQEIYDMFIEDVAKGRGLSADYIREVAEGKVYSGPGAVEVKLADDVGTRHDAVMKAGEMGGIEGEPGTTTYERKKFFFDDFVATAFYNFGKGFARGMVEMEGVPQY